MSIERDAQPRAQDQDTATPSPDTTYDVAHFEQLFAVEQQHAWFRARNELIGELARELTADLTDGFRVLEVGCGTGAVLRVLELACGRGVVAGLDRFEQGLRFARQRTDCPLVIGDANAPPFGREFALVGLFDVLEHLPDDGGVLARMRELLIPGGRLMLTVPADPTLWSYFDVAAHHVRRYELDELREKLVTAGYTVEYATHFMTALAPLLRSYRRLAAASGGKEPVARDLRVVPVVNDLMYWLLTRERRSIRARRELRRGTSILAIARHHG